MTTAKITKKGQVTIPRDIRKVLGGQVVEFVVTDAGVLIKPVESVAGSLARYRSKSADFEDARTSTWNKAVREKAGR
ncbi:MAG: AbrB/MazE/SpoVT family DNA-binding domain-containing protein [Spirochaetota bacterium]